MLGANPNPHYIYLCKRRIGVLKADEMFKSLGYEVSNSEFVEELNTTTNTVVDKGYIKIRGKNTDAYNSKRNHSRYLTYNQDL